MNNYLMTAAFHTDRPLTDAERVRLESHVAVQLDEPVDDDGNTVDFELGLVSVASHETDPDPMRAAWARYETARQDILAISLNAIAVHVRSIFPTAAQLGIDAEHNEDAQLRTTIRSITDLAGVRLAAPAAVERLDLELFDELCTIAELDPGEWEHADTMELPE